MAQKSQADVRLPPDGDKPANRIEDLRTEPTDPTPLVKLQTAPKKSTVTAASKTVKKKKKKLLPKKLLSKQPAQVDVPAAPVIEEEIKGVFDHLLNYDGSTEPFDDNDDGTRVAQSATIKPAQFADSLASVASQKNQLTSISKLSTALGSTDRKRQIVRPRKEEDPGSQKTAASKRFEDSSQQFELLSTKDDQPRKLSKKARPTELAASNLPMHKPPSLLLNVSTRSVEKPLQLPRFSKLPDLYEGKTSKSQASNAETSPDKHVRSQQKSSSVQPQSRSILDQFVRVDSREHNGSLTQTSASYFSNNRPLVVTQTFERPSQKRRDLLNPNLQLFSQQLVKKELEGRKFAAAPLPQAGYPVQSSLTFDDETLQELTAGRSRPIGQTTVPFKELVRSREDPPRSINQRQSAELLRSNSKEIQLMISVVSNKQDAIFSALPPIRSQATIGSSASPKRKPAQQKLGLLIGTDLRPEKTTLAQDSYLLDSESDDYTQLLKDKRLHF